MSGSVFCLPSNPDISGIGVRVAIYAQNLLSFVPALFALHDMKVTPVELESLETQSTTILITAFAILLSVIVQALQGQLTNYHASIILTLSWMNNTSLFIYFLLHAYRTLELYEEDRKQHGARKGFWIKQARKALKNSVYIIGSAHLTLMSAVGIWLWQKPAAFGDSPPCSLSASLVILGQRTSIGNDGLRTWSLLIYSVLITPGLNLIIPIAFFAAPIWVYSRSAFISLDCKTGIILARTGLAMLATINVILLVDIELAITQNRLILQHGDGEWTFGQTLALLLLLIPMRDIAEALLEKRAKKLGSKLLYAATKGHIEVVQDAIKSGASRDATDPALHAAVEHGRWKVVELLVENGATMSDRDNFLRSAAMNGDLKGIKLLMKMGASKDATDLDGHSAIHLAAEKLRFNVVKFLLGASEDDLPHQSVLYLAAQEGRADVLKLLIQNGVDIDEKASNGETALHEAAQKGNADVVGILIDHNANMDVKSENPDKNGYTALHYAAKSGYAEVVKLLGERGANVNETDNDGQIPHHYAAENGYAEVIRLLANFGSDVNTKNHGGQIGLHYAAEQGQIEVIKLLIELGVTVEARDNRGINPLHRSAEHGHLEVVRLLAEHGVDINAKNENGLVALHYATIGGHIEIVRFLIGSGADVDAWVIDDACKIALHYAASNGHVEIIKLLVERGGRENAADQEGCSPLIHALQCDHIDAMKALVELGADVNFTDDEWDGLTALHYACMMGKTEAIRLLVEHGADMSKTTVKWGSRPIHFAAQNGYVEAVRTLAELGDSLEAKNSSGWGALHYSAVNGELEVAKLLFSFEANSERPSDAGCSRPELHDAQAHDEHINAERTPVRFSPTSEDLDEALSLADNRGRVNVAEYLIARGAKRVKI